MIMRHYSLTAVLLLVTVPAAAADDPFTVTDRAGWRLKAAGLPEVSGTLFAWHGAWKFATARVDSRDGETRRGHIPAGDGRKVLFRMTPARKDGALVLRYVFRREADLDLTRGVMMMLNFRPVPKGRALRLTGRPPVKLGTQFAAAGRGFGVNLSDERALEVRTDRTCRLDGAFYNKRFHMRMALRGPDFPQGADAAVTVTVALKPAGSDKLGWQLLARDGKLAIRAATPAAARVPVNAPATVDVDLAATYENPFDPAQVALDAAITAPGGAVMNLPGYYHRDYRAARDGGAETIEPAGEPGWRVRFTPTKPGDYTVRLTARDRSGTTTAGPLTVTATPSTLPGMVRIGPHKRYFMRDGGRCVFLIGHNVTSYQSGAIGMAETFDRMAAGGENFTRIWMWSRALGLEWGGPVGCYRLPEAWRLDHLMALARERGIHILLCLDTHQDFRERLAENPYHRSNGGFIETPLEFFTSDKARAAYRTRLRYVVARWSHCTNLVAWEFLNESEGWKGFFENRETVGRWHAAMARHLKNLDPYDHPVTTSCWTTGGHRQLWGADGIDVLNTHHYSNTKTDMARRTAEIARMVADRFPGRPNLFSEMGIHYKFRPGFGDDEDPAGLHLHKQHWAGLCEGLAGGPANWWHRGYFEKYRLQERFRGIAAFAGGIDFSRPWKPMRDLQPRWVDPPETLETDDLAFSARHGAWRLLTEPLTVRIRPDGTIDNRLLIPKRHYGTGEKHRAAVTFSFTMPAPGALVMKVGRRNGAGRLAVTLDGDTVIDEPLKKGGERRVPLPAGPRTLTIANAGAGYFEINNYRITGFLSNRTPPAAAHGLCDGTAAIVWIRNTNHWWLPAAQGKHIEPVGPVTLAVPALPAGTRCLQRYDTTTGQMIERSTADAGADGPVIRLEKLKTDAAFRIGR